MIEEMLDELLPNRSKEEVSSWFFKMLILFSLYCIL